MEDFVADDTLTRSSGGAAPTASFRAPEREEIEAAVRRLPPLPALLQELLKELHDRDADIQRLEERVSSDPGLMTRVLKMANSPFYARQSEVVDVSRALMTLGFRTVSNLVVAAGLRSSMKGAARVPGFEPNGIFLHSLATGLGCSRLGNFVPSLREHREFLFVAGVMHDVGRVALAEFYAPHASRLVMREDLALGPEVERRLLDTDHQEVGRLVHVRWNLPDELETVITRHHDPVESLAQEPVTLAVALVDAVLNRQGFGRTQQQPNAQTIEDCARVLGTDAEKVGDRLADIGDEVQSVVGTFA
jgi:HD-like signal output (HDOD) protein